MKVARMRDETPARIPFIPNKPEPATPNFVDLAPKIIVGSAIDAIASTDYSSYDEYNKK